MPLVKTLVTAPSLLLPLGKTLVTVPSLRPYPFGRLRSLLLPLRASCPLEVELAPPRLTLPPPPHLPRRPPQTHRQRTLVQQPALRPCPAMAWLPPHPTPRLTPRRLPPKELLAQRRALRHLIPRRPHLSPPHRPHPPHPTPS